MCLIVIGIDAHPDYPLILLGNRDEFYERPTKNFFFWKGKEFYAGKDLEAGGTWMAVAKSGKFAAITNIRDPKNLKLNCPSRGNIVVDFMDHKFMTIDFLKNLKEKCLDYNGFNIICGDLNGQYFMNSYEKDIILLEKGVYGLSNGSLNSDWPKVNEIRAHFKDALSNNYIDNQLLMAIMESNIKYDESTLPNTGISIEMEKLLSPIFIQSPIYGTRSTTLLSIHYNGLLTIIEKNHLLSSTINVNTFIKKMKFDN